MIRHIVLVRFADSTPAGEIEAVFADLAALKSHLPGMRGFAAGANVSPERLDKGFTHAFTIDFEDVAARDAYLDHPAHKAAGARLLCATADGLDALAVIDLAL